MKEKICITLNRKQTTQNYSKYSLTVFEPQVHIRIRPKTDAIPLGQTKSLKWLLKGQNCMFGLNVFSTQN